MCVAQESPGVLDTMDTINSITTRLKIAAFHSLNRARTIICCDIQKLVYLGRIVNMWVTSPISLKEDLFTIWGSDRNLLSYNMYNSR